MGRPHPQPGTERVSDTSVWRPTRDNERAGIHWRPLAWKPDKVPYRARHWLAGRPAGCVRLGTDHKGWWWWRWCEARGRPWRRRQPDLASD